MTQPEDFGSEFQDFVSRVEELRASRTAPGADHPVLLDAALLELQHIVETMGPVYEVAASSHGRRGASGVQDDLRLFKAIFEQLPLPVALVDAETVVRSVNSAAVRLIGAPAGYASGRQLSGFLGPGDRIALRIQVAAVARGDGGRGITVRLPHQPDLPVHVTLSALRLTQEPHATVLVVLGPVTGAAPLPDTPQDSGPGTALTGAVSEAALMDLLDTCTRTLLRGLSGKPDDPLTAVTGVLRERLADWAVLDLVRAGTLHRSAVLGLAGNEDTTLEKAIGQQDPCRCPAVAEAAATGAASLHVRPDDLNCLGSDDRGASLCVRADVASLLTVPLKAGPADGSPVSGVLTLVRTGARPSFSLAEARAAEVVVRHMAIALERLPAPVTDRDEARDNAG
ncbi:MAG TPA: PAS domain-containing protein [Streptomyces sp.]